MRYYIFLTFLLSSVMFSQLSTKHWLPPLHARLSVVGGHYLYLSTPESVPFAVTVTNGKGVPISGSPFTISQNNPITIFVNDDQPSNMFRLVQDVNVVTSNYGFILEAKKKFYTSFKVEKKLVHAEILVSKGLDGIGTKFRVGSVIQGSSSSIRNFVTSFMATENNTTVTVSDYDTDVVFVSGKGDILLNSQTFNLNAGQSVILSGYTSHLANLTGFIGALLSSNKPIAVSTGNALGATINPIGQDFNLDQIVPYEQVGKKYVLIRGNGSDFSEYPLVIATQDNTDIFVNGIATPITTLNAGDYIAIPSTYYQGSNNKNMYIESSKPIYMYQIVGGSKGNYASGMNFIPPLSCFFPQTLDLASINAIGNSTFSTDIIALTSVGSTITVNGTRVKALPQVVLGNSSWVSYRISGYTGNVKITSTGPLAAGIFGATGSAGFAGYYSGFGFELLKVQDLTIQNNSALCPDEIKVLDTGLDPTIYNFVWTKNDVVIAGATGPSYTVKKPGTYCVTSSYITSNGSCVETDCVKVEYHQQILINYNPADLKNCSNNFNLSDHNATILNGLDPNFHHVLFFASAIDAQNGFPQISSFQTTKSTTTTFYASVSRDGFQCKAYTEFDAVVLVPPTADDLADVTVCNYYTLPVLTTGNYFTQTNGGGTAYNAGDVISTTTTLFVYAETGTTPNCSNENSLTITILPQPTASIKGATVCAGSTATVTILGTPNATVNYTVDGVSQTAVVLNTSGIATLSTTVAGTYCLVDVASNTTPFCVQALSQCDDVIVKPSLPIKPVVDIRVCDDNNDGSAPFNLSGVSAQANGGDGSLTVTIHPTLSDANFPSNALTTAQIVSYPSANNTLYIRVQNLGGCYSITTVKLFVDPRPALNQNVSDYSLCETSNTADGFEVFDLTKTFLTTSITNGVAGISLSYYISLSNAKSGTSAIETLSAYENEIANQQTIWVVGTNAAGCKHIISFDLIVNPTPKIVAPANPLAECDDILADGIAYFNLTQVEAEVLDGIDPATVTITYHTTQTAANVGNPFIGNILNYPGTNGEVIYIRVEFNATGCYSVEFFSLVVNLLPVVANTTFRECDDDTDGIATFTLNSSENLLLLLGSTQLPADFTVSYYDSVINAQNGAATGLLNNVYTNNTKTQIIYPRVVNNTTGCVNVLAEVTLFVRLKAFANPITQNTLDNSFIKCDYTGDYYDGIAEFNLTDAETDILGSQLASEMTITYYANLTDYNAGASIPAAELLMYKNSPFTQTIYVLVERNNVAPGMTAPCFDMTTFDLVVEPLANPIITTPDNSHTICVEWGTNVLLSGLTLDSGISATKYTFQWTLNATDIPGATGATHTIITAAPGEYTVVATSTTTLACASQTAAVFNVIQSGPAANAQFFIKGSFEDIQTITILNDGFGTYHYQLDEGGPIVDNGGIFENVPAGIHTVYIHDVKTNNPCGPESVRDVSIINYPHFFTPNGDGINDVWKIIGLSSQTNAKIYIFDRYGKLIKQISSDEDSGWNGTFNGQPLPATDYWFTVEYYEITPLGVLVPKQFKAHFSLKR